MGTITKESIVDTIEGLEQLTNRGIQSVYIEMAIAGMRRLQASLEAEPVAGEARFKEENHWSPCTSAHVAMVQDNPDDWPNYEVRYLYTAPPTPMLPEEMPKGLAGQIVSLLAHNIGDKFLAQKIWNACRAAAKGE